MWESFGKKLMGTMLYINIYVISVPIGELCKRFYLVIVHRFGWGNEKISAAYKLLLVR